MGGGNSWPDAENDDPAEKNDHSPDSVCEHSTGPDAGSEQHSRWARWRAGLQSLLLNRRTPSTLSSLVLHALTLLILAFWGMPLSRDFTGDVPGTLSLRQTEDSQPMDAQLQLADDSTAAPPMPVSIDTQLLQNQPTPDSVPQLELVPRLEQEGSLKPTLTANPLLEKLQSMNHQNLVARFSNTGIDGRRSKNRTEIAMQRGGSIESEKAVEAALVWLSEHQLPDGSWSLLHDRGNCNGRCSHPGSPDRFDPAATGLSLLAFLGAGYTHLDGKYQQSIRRAIYYLRQIAVETEHGKSFLHLSDRGMYNHGIVAFALCEAYQLTQDPDLKELCQQAIDFIVYAQSYQGGWGYSPKMPGDLTISGWQMMALKSASAAGLDVPPATIWKTSHFLNSQMAEDQVTYFYRIPQDQSVTCTAIGILLRMFLGQSWTHPNIISGLRVVSSHNDYGNDIYYRYYATLALFHAGGPMWEEWNQRCRDYLISTQSTEGHEAGSWYFENHFGKEGGRLYTTAMAAMTLEVYYRFSPLYQQTDEPFEL